MRDEVGESLPWVCCNKEVFPEEEGALSRKEDGTWVVSDDAGYTACGQHNSAEDNICVKCIHFKCGECSLAPESAVLHTVDCQPPSKEATEQAEAPLSTASTSTLMGDGDVVNEVS